MKKLVLFSLCAIACAVCSAQKIISDRSENNLRFVSTNEFNQGGIATTDTRLTYSVVATATLDTTYYLCVHVYSYTSVYASRSKLLVRCGNGEVLELQSTQEDEHDRVGDYSTLTGFTTYNVNLLYELDYDDIPSLCTGMSKIRVGVVQNGTDMFEREFSEKQCKRLASKFTEAFRNIDNSLANSRGFSDGF